MARMTVEMAEQIVAGWRGDLQPAEDWAGSAEALFSDSEGEGTPAGAGADDP
jgi:hypothetical protein